MKILGHRHTGILTNDLDKMIGFYLGLGFILKSRDLESGAFVENLVDSEGIVLDTAKLIIKDDDIPIKNQFVLELMSIINGVNSRKVNEILHFDFNSRANGVLDIAFTVDDINAVCQYVLDQGGDLISKPLKSVGGYPAWHCYLRDPEGNVLHIAENLID